MAFEKVFSTDVPAYWQIERMEANLRSAKVHLRVMGYKDKAAAAEGTTLEVKDFELPLSVLASVSTQLMQALYAGIKTNYPEEWTAAKEVS